MIIIPTKWIQLGVYPIFRHTHFAPFFPTDALRGPHRALPSPLQPLRCRRWGDDGDGNLWDMDRHLGLWISQYMESHKNPWFQTTNLYHIYRFKWYIINFNQPYMALYWGYDGDVEGYYTLVNVYMAIERSTIFHGKIHYFYHHFQ